MKTKESLEELAASVAREQFEVGDMSEYSREDVIEDVTKLLVWFHKEMLKRK